MSELEVMTFRQIFGQVDTVVLQITLPSGTLHTRLIVS